ncbi:MAG TPA: hypothetical protein VJZ00_12490, partial [Thermoanaerobaculia bacterium]|nr:hypothetical protein [Thermoanaerobaculia bacterium]
MRDTPRRGENGFGVIVGRKYGRQRRYIVTAVFGDEDELRARDLDFFSQLTWENAAAKRFPFAGSGRFENPDSVRGVESLRTRDDPHCVHKLRNDLVLALFVDLRNRTANDAVTFHPHRKTSAQNFDRVATRDRPQTAVVRDENPAVRGPRRSRPSSPAHCDWLDREPGRARSRGGGQAQKRARQQDADER